jgi:hypothetical protein
MAKRKYEVRFVKIEELKPHPRNYRKHPADQIRHIVKSLEVHGVYRNVVVARDFTILAGHGVVEAAKKAGLTEIPVCILDVDAESPEALKVLVGDNYQSHLAEDDDRLLSEVLREIKETTDDLLSTGFDEKMLANLVLVTRPETEIPNLNAAMEWVGLPEYAEKGDIAEDGDTVPKLVISFPSKQDRERFIEMNNLVITNKLRECWSCWWPRKEQLKKKEEVIHFVESEE